MKIADGQQRLRWFLLKRQG